MKTDVIILNWNGADMLRRFLPSVVEGTAGDARIVVADNGSTDASMQILREDFPQVEVLNLAANHGFAEGYNRAIAMTDAENIVLLNSDVEVTPGWLRPLARYMDAHPECAACQPKLLAVHDRHSFEYAGASGGFIDRYGYPFCRGRVMEVVEKDLGQYDDEAEVFWATGAALYIRRADYEAAGGLDRRFFAHMEEIDLCWRLQSMGRKVACVPSSVVYHVGGGTLNQGNPRKTQLNFRNNLLMLYKNLPQSELRHVMRVRRLLDHVAAFKMLITGDTANAKAVLRARAEFRKMQPSYAPVRAEVQSRAKVGTIPTQMPSSLLLRFFLGGGKTYTRLQKYFTP